MNAQTRIVPILAAVAALLAVAGCTGGSSSPVAPVAKATAVATASSASQSATTAVPYGAKLLAGAKLVGRANLKSVGLNVELTMRDQTGLLAYAKESNDPKNPLYRHWLTPQEIGDKFGADASQYTATAAYFESLGIAVKQYPQRQLLRIKGPQAAVEHALGTQFGFFRKNGSTFLAPMIDPKPPSSLHIAELGNAIHYTKKTRRFVRLRAANSLIEGYSPQQIANGFDYSGAYAEGYKGAGITIGIIGTAGITDGDSRIAGAGDVADYRSLYGITGTGTVTQDIDTMNVSPGNTTGGSGDEFSQGLSTPPPVTSPTYSGCTTPPNDYNPNQSQGFPGGPGTGFEYTMCLPEDTEAQLDTEQASALAPDANVNFYIAFNMDECFSTSQCTADNEDQEIGLELSDDEIQQAIKDNLSDVITMSFGESEYDSETGAPGYFGPGTNGFGPTEMAMLASEGTAIFVSSGDNGAEECVIDGADASGSPDVPCVNYPATDPNAISVGGVNAPFDSSGRLTGPITGWGTATQISDPSVQAGGSGGGCSIFFPPATGTTYSSGDDVTATTATYQTGITLPCGSYRPQPDVALDADTNTGVAVVVDAAPSLGGRMIEAVGGTSVAAPEMAAMWALVLQACKQSSSCSPAQGGGTTYSYRLGNPGIYLYSIYKNPTQYAATFYDVLFGDNALPQGGFGDNPLDPGFLAGTGYDQVTGIGVPFAKNLITNVLSQVQ